MSRRTGTVLFLVLVLWASVAGAQAQPDFDRDVLGAIDTVPTRAALDAAFPDAREQLIAAAGDDARGLYARQRAITLLSFYADAQTRQFLEGMVATEKSSDLRGMAVYTLGRTYGPVADAELVSTLTTVAAQQDEAVAAWAIRALRWVYHPDATAALKQLANDAQSDSLRRIAASALRKSVYTKTVK